MPKNLVIVESPAKAKTIKKYLGRNYSVLACFGSIRDLPKSQMGVDIENNFEPKYIIMREERACKAVKEIKAAAAKAEKVFLATDPDREGEAIAWHVAEILKANKKTTDVPCLRITFDEITKDHVKDAVKKRHKLDMHLVNAQQGRRVIDRLMGYSLSPLLAGSIRKGLSAGRVQSAAVRMVVEREEAIKGFVPEEYWSIGASMLTERDEPFVARLHQRDGVAVRLGEEGQIGNEAEATSIVEALRGQSYSVTDVKRKEVRRRPPPPFITSTLQQDASRKLGMTPATSMALAQQLYQGVELGEQGPVGLITYMRTDSVRLSDEALDDARAYIRDRFDEDMLPEKPTMYRNKKDAQDAHEAIRPSSAHLSPEDAAAYLDERQLKLYTLIWQRFVACQMLPAVLDQTTVDIKAGDFTLRASGSVMKFPGFTKLYEESAEDANNADEKDDKEKLLPVINANEEAKLQELTPEQHFTKPPPRYSEASLVRAMEENGIGRPSTYAPTIKTILDRAYVNKDGRRLAPTDLGVEVNAWLTSNFPNSISIDFTARMEAELDSVEEGNLEWQSMTQDWYGPFSENLESAEKQMVLEKVGEDPRCPVCNSPAVLKQSWFGLYMGCTRHPACKGTISISRASRPPEPTDETCTQCGAPMVIRTGRFGRFMACSAFPECKFVINLDKNGKMVPPKPPPKKTNEQCPKCDEGFLVIRTSRAGEEFYGCERFPKCRFTRPIELHLPCLKNGCSGELERKGRGKITCTECDFQVLGRPDKETPCPRCGNSWTSLKKPRNKPRVRTCPSPTCGHSEEIPDPIELAEGEAPGDAETPAGAEASS